MRKIFLLFLNFCIPREPTEVKIRINNVFVARDKYFAVVVAYIGKQFDEFTVALERPRIPPAGFYRMIYLDRQGLFV